MAKYTVADLERSSTGLVFVVNRTSGRNRSDVVFSVPGVNGGQGESILVPSTWIPIDLTTFATRQQLINSVPFRRLVADGHLEIVDEASAQKVLSTQEAREEYEVIRNQQRISETLGASPEMVVGNDDIQDPARRKATMAAKTGSTGGESSEPDVLIQQLVLRLKSEEITEGQANSQLRTIVNDLTKADIAYMIAELSKDKFPRICTFLTEEGIRRGMTEEVDSMNSTEE